MMIDAKVIAPVYIAARALIDFMDLNSGAATGELIQKLRNAIVETDELQIPEFLRRTKPRETATGLEDLL